MGMVMEGKVFDVPGLYHTHDGQGRLGCYQI